MDLLHSDEYTVIEKTEQRVEIIMGTRDPVTGHMAEAGYTAVMLNGNYVVNIEGRIYYLDE